MDNINNKEFKIKDIVWAKAKGNPWWPGIIKNISFYNIEKDNQIIKEKIYKIDFIGEKSHVTLTKEDIQLFIDNYKERLEHISSKNQSLIKSIKLAKELYNKRCSQKNMHSGENFNGNIIEIKDYINKEKIFLNNKRKKNGNYNTNSNYERSIYDIESGSERNCSNNLENKNSKKIKKKIIVQNNDNKLLFKEKNKNDNIKINININLTNNNNSTFNIFGLPQINSLNNNSYINHNIKKDTLNIINNKIIQDCEEENNNQENELIKSSIFVKNKIINDSKNDYIVEKDETNKNENKEIIKDNDNNIIDKEMNKLYQQLQICNPINESNILQELNTFYNIISKNIINNQNQMNYLKNKHIISELFNLSFHQNNDIKQISLNIISIIKEYIINNLFIFQEEEKT